MRKAELSDRTIRNYVGVLRALFNYAADKRRRWTARDPVDDVELPRAPTYGEIRYLTTAEVRALIEAAKPVPITGMKAMTYEPLDKPMIVTAAMTGLRIGELQALDWRSIDFIHAGIRVRRTWDRKAKTYTKPNSRRSERAVPMPDEVAGHLLRLLSTYHPGTVEPNPDSLVLAHPVTGDRSATKPCTTACAPHSRRQGSMRRSHGTTCATATARHSQRRACRCARCSSGWATRTSRPPNGMRTTARTPASATSSRPHSREVPIRVPICQPPHVLSATQVNEHGAAHPTATPTTGFESHPGYRLNANEHGLLGPLVDQSVCQFPARLRAMNDDDLRTATFRLLDGTTETSR